MTLSEPFAMLVTIDGANHQIDTVFAVYRAGNMLRQTPLAQFLRRSLVPTLVH